MGNSPFAFLHSPFSISTMSFFHDDRYTWRETYFVLFGDLRRRPLLDELKWELRHGMLKILDGTANPKGRLRTLTLASYEDHSALEIVFRYGSKVAAEIDALVRTLEKGCTPKEMERLLTAKNWAAKFDVLHFEQLAGTAAFDVVKVPELKFQTPVSDSPQRESFTTANRANRPACGTKFQFDPSSYANCLAGGVGDEYNRMVDEFEADSVDSSVYERVDPTTLVLVLETLSRLTGGIAIDPASGTFF